MARCSRLLMVLRPSILAPERPLTTPETRVKKRQVLASQTYPVNEWLDLGTFTAKFVQGEQTFEIPQPAFAR